MRKGFERLNFLQFRVNRAERNILERFAQKNGAIRGRFSTFYREMLLNIATEGLRPEIIKNANPPKK